MQKQIKKWVSLILTVLLICSTIPFYTLAADDTEGSSGAATLHEYESVDGDTGTMENEGAFVDGEVETSELDEDKVLNNLNITNGLPETESIIEEGVMEAGTGEEATEGLSDFVYEGDTNEDTAEQTPSSGSGYETNAAGPYITLSSTSTTVNCGSTAKITVGFGGYNGTVYMSYGLNNSNVKASWGSWSKNKIPISITGMSAGTSKVSIYLKAANNNRTLASTTVSVTIKNTVSMSLSQTSLDTVYGKQKSVYVGVSGVNSSMKLNYNVTSGSSVKCAWGSKTNGKYPLKISGAAAGTSKIKISVISSTGATLAYKTLTVYVSRNASLSVSPSSFTIAPGEKKTTTVSYSGAYGSLHMTYSLSNSKVACSWGSWSGSKVYLYTTGKTVGSSTVTVRLYNGSDDLLATKTIAATVKENVTLKCSVSSLSLTAGQSQRITWTFSGTSASVYYQVSVSNSSICSASWYGSWNGNSHAMTVNAKTKGSATITVYLKNGSTTLAQKSITVNVTGTPSVELSQSSISLKVGAQTTITATAKNISGDYTLRYSTSGSCFSCSWTSKIVNDKASLTVKGTKKGSGSLTVSLLNSSGSAVASKTISVSVSSSEDPKVWLSASSLTVTDNSSGKVTATYSGVSDSVYLSYSLSNSKVTAQWGSWTNSSIPLTITGKSEGTTTVTVYLKRASNNAVLASTTLTVTININTDEISLLSYNFDNYSADIPLSTFYLAFGTNTKAKRLHDAYHNAGGVCYGMAATSMLYRQGEVGLTSFSSSARRIWDLLKTHKNSLLNLSVQNFIELMFITQYSTITANTEVSGLNALCSKVAAGNKVQVAIYGPYGNGMSGHSLVGYKLDKTNNRLYVYDCNYPGTKRYISLSGSYGNYKGWTYNLFGSTTWNNSNGDIAYQEYSAIRNQWTNRGRLSVADGWLKNANILLTNSDHFEIYDVDDHLIATYSEGVLDSNIDEVLNVNPMGVNPNGDGTNEIEYNLFYLPTNYYSIKNLDKNVDLFKAEMIDEELGVVVETQADNVSFGVDDAFDLSATNMDLEKGESYEVMLLSSREDEKDHVVCGVAEEDTLNLGFSVLNGVFTSSNAEGVSMTSLGDSQQNVSIKASATEGGTITPAGKTTVMSGTNFSYKIAANGGYELVDVLVNGESVGAVFEYTFVQIDADSTIEAVFEKTETPTPHTHTYTSAVTTQPGCTTAGVRTYTCVDGDHSYTESIPALGHTDPDSNGNCSRCGTHLVDVVDPNACPQCGQVHKGFFGSIVGFFHRLIYRLTHLFG